MSVCLLTWAASLAFFESLAAAGQMHTAEGTARSNPALEQFKALAGEWEGQDKHGNVFHATYENLASGVVMERLEAKGEGTMVTMYSLDGDHIVAIHFCSSGNQPVLKTGPVSAATGKYDFVTERTYGLSSPQDLHMVELLVTLTDRDHFSQVWTNLNHGKRSSYTISLVRKK